MPDVAELLGVSQSALYLWRQQDLIDRGLKPGTSRVESTALVGARKRIRELEEEVKILRKAADAVEQVVRPKGRFQLVDELAADGVRVRRACLALGVSVSGYYEWKHRAPSARTIRHAWLTDLIGQIHEASYGTYGRLRVTAELERAHGLRVGVNTVWLLMHRAGLQGLPLRRRAKRVPSQGTVTDLVKRRVVGWAIDTAQRADLATNALGMAIDSRRPSPGTIIHGDHGVQFTSWAFTSRARNAGLLPSLGTIGDPYDNAVVESFWARMQVELLNRRRWKTRVELANAIFEYIEGFHNRRRRHGALGWATPLEFEQQHHQRARTPNDRFQSTGA